MPSAVSQASDSIPVAPRRTASANASIVFSGAWARAPRWANAIGGTANYDYDARRLLTNASYGTATCGNNQQPPIYTTL